VQELLTKSAELYATAPSFFNWMLGIVPTMFALAASGGYWLCSQLRSRAVETQAAQIKFLEHQLSAAKQSAANVNAAVVDAKKEAYAIRQATPYEGRSLDAFLSAAQLDIRLVSFILNTALSLAKAIASGKELEVPPALEYQPLVPMNMEKEAKQTVSVHLRGGSAAGENIPQT
jgi:hypothetical protein